MIHFIVATHGPLATALLESGRMVYGDLPNVHAVCLTEQAGIEGFRQDFSATLKAASANAEGVLVLCDMQSGTPWNVACEAAFTPLTKPPVAVVAGVNFPMLLQTDEVMMARDVHHAAAQLIELTLPTLVQAKPADIAQTDDF
ncbi:TPA: PTS fructose transporter subunit IIA [Enterobacter hormaechei]|uniref:PTS sugar transporter subunit IIA n=1 Tax=Enterobacter hormaechei TaxID=158836 RepID=UPI00286269DE|nr:PTS fructose transporter subunit IIA [Enterobacter hormaechei]ELD3466800.1 PTS fructose transporter subunit IIA [Enterobacter hormaechei]MED5730117.1 PTS fructose transporter subunit IIA [Enterobacter hormaechei]HBM2510297.1 PTS fructose transporter subunit IIA [Enterobacter hormaechei]HBM2519176.1 PTS fructose transporter subunit IIA [Enterobacter hormaechei]HBM2528252.1 PTS fructose transporter subunit IIA [Enterobacter hormaechei]